MTQAFAAFFAARAHIQLPASHSPFARSKRLMAWSADYMYA